MRALRSWLLLGSLASAVAAIALVPSPASAFVSPGYRVSRARRTLVGTWRIVGDRKGGVIEEIDPTVRIDITASTLHRRVGKVPDPNVGRYDVLREDETSLDLRVVFVEDVLDVDVLIETPDALTLYVRSEQHDEDERAVRLERVDE